MHMSYRTSIAVLVAWGLFGGAWASAHPGSGIVVDSQGQVYFTHSGRGVAKIDAQGRLNYVHDSKGGHWMCLDAEGSFARTQPKFFTRITPEGVKPALIFADGGSPVAVARDGHLYYASNDDRMTPGGLQLTRMSTDGRLSLPFPDLRKMTEKLGITGLAAVPDGSVYIACPSAVLMVKADGTVVTIAHPVVVADCDEDLPDNIPSPYLRGLDVDTRGTVYAAATGCGRVVKITADGKVEVILKSERPWLPTGVAVHGEDIYILEYTNANGSPNEGWRPRVRKLGRDGKATTLVTVSSEGGSGVPR
jgi:DNA-binding beta-propeller fold protein YncE